jgi:DNA-binding response OmpR family regulator
MNDRDESLRRARETMRRLQHEVRTPIGQIIGYAELLEEELEDYGAGELAADLQKIRDAASRLLDLVDGKLRDEQDPGAPVLPEQGEAPSQEEGSESAALDSERPVRVLVVDEDASDRELLARRLERHGFTVETARDGIDALRQIDADAPDVVLLEVMMSGMGGLEVLERVRRQRSRAELPIILATALDDSQDAVEGLERGANDYVTKPFDFPVVIARVQSQLEAHRTARQVAELARQLEFRSTFIREALGRDVSDDLLVAMAEQPDVLDLGRERRRVVAVVADVRGSRQRAATLEPAQETGVLKNVLDGLSAVVTHHGGVVEEVSGDSLVALFGLPLGAADDAERAAACALAMQLEMDEINDRGARVQLPAVEIGVGVASGDVAVVSLGTGDQVNYKAVGEPPLHATALEAQARGGEVWICARTRERLGELANVDREREVPPEGPGGPALRAHRLLGLGGSRLISLRSVPRD